MHEGTESGHSTTDARRFPEVFAERAESLRPAQTTAPTERNPRRPSCRAVLRFCAGFTLLLASTLAVWAGGGALEISGGYFWDPVSGQPFIPRGIAYQSFNPPVGANQSFEQV